MSSFVFGICNQGHAQMTVVVVQVNCNCNWINDIYLLIVVVTVAEDIYLAVTSS